MNFDLLTKTLETLGTLMIAFAALRVHHRVLNEHKIDGKVFSIMKKEQYIGMLGAIFVLAGFVIELIKYL